MSLLSQVVATSKPVVAECGGCGEQENGFCKRYPDPGARWAFFGHCPMHTGLLEKSRKAAAEQAAGKPVNPIKAAKRAMGKK